jgi:hypothetical protein
MREKGYLIKHAGVRVKVRLRLEMGLEIGFGLSLKIGLEIELELPDINMLGSPEGRMETDIV